MLLYRFRRLLYGGVEKFCQYAIDGTVFDALRKDVKDSELPIVIDWERLSKKYKYDPILMKALENGFRKHAIENYYLICFDTVDQLNDKEMRREYADDTGFCLIYEEDDIKNKIKETMIKDNAFFATYKEVEKVDSKTNVSILIEKFFSKIKDRQYDNEEAVKYAADHWDDDVSPYERKIIVDSFFHKIGTFPEKNERRIVILAKKPKGNRPPKPYIRRALTVKPKKVVCSSKMPEKCMEIIRKKAKREHIAFSIQDVEKI